MKNMKIEAILREQEEVIKKFGCDSEEFKEFYKKFNNGTWTVISYYIRSNDKGFDEIVFDNDACIWEKDVADIVVFCREAKIGWFVFGSGYSRAMEVIMHLVDAGAKVGKFVVKEYKDSRFGEEEIVRVPGMRINL